jgi:LemA protein
MASIVTIAVGFFLLLVLVGAGFYVVGMYNRLVRVDERVDNAWADIDVLLKQRRDALEKLVDTMQEAMDYEQDLLTDVVEAREQTRQADSPTEAAKATAAVRDALSGISIRAEDHPDASAVENAQSLQGEIAQIEEQIADRREVYNEAVTAHNQLIRQVPYVLIASQLGFTERDLFDPPEAQTADVDISSMMNEASAEG